MKALLPLSEQEKLDRLRLIRSENIGPVTFRELMARFGSAEAALDALPTLARRGGRKRELRIASQTEIRREVQALTNLGGQILCIGAPEYPPLLAAIDDAPPVISVIGHPALLQRECLGIVGARNASTNGKELARRFASEIGGTGLTIVSGMAMGIDAAAHEAALETGTVAVLGGGVDVIYPRDNTRLYEEICRRGAVLSEMPLGTVPQARHFPRRNRIISGLSRALLVVEATQRSGSLITARQAADQGREVMAIPGSPMDPRARGPNKLIRHGAALVESPEDVLDLMQTLPIQQLDARAGTPFEATPLSSPDESDLTKARNLVADRLGPTPVQLDNLAADLDLPMGILAVILLEMELAGRLERSAGNRVCKIFKGDTSTGSDDPPSRPNHRDLFDAV